MPGVHIALLRGINVGGKNILPMKALAAIFEAVGCRDVRTYIQSGNVVFTAAASTVTKLPRSVPKAIADEFGIEVPVVVRSAAEWRKVLKGNPFLDEGPPEALAVSFLSSVPTAARAKRLDPDRSPGDRFALVGREVFLHLPNGVARSKITAAWLDSTLGVTSTARNWRSLNKIAALAGL